MFNRQEMNVPELTLDLRITPLVKSVVAKMLLSEKDVEAQIMQAVEDAVASTDWHSQIEKEVRGVIKACLQSNVEHMISSVFWNEEIMKQFRELVSKAIQRQLEKG